MEGKRVDEENKWINFIFNYWIIYFFYNVFAKNEVTLNFDGRIIGY